MPSPSYRSSASAAAQTAGTFSVSKPAGTTDGDLLVAFQVTSLGGGSAPATPTGWTLLTSQAFNLSTGLIQAFYKAASGEGASWTFNNSGGGISPDTSVYVVAVQNGATTPEGSAKNNGNSGSADPGAYTTTNANDLILTAWAIPINAGGTVTPHASYTALGSIGDGTVKFNAGYKSQAAAGATANTTAALDTTYNWGAMTVAVNGAAAAAVTGSVVGSRRGTIGGLRRHLVFRRQRS